MAKINRDEVDKFFDYGIDLTNSTIYMGSEYEDGDGESGVDSQMTARIIKALHLLDLKDKDITIIMNNPGGDAIHGMAIYDAIKACKNQVTVKVFGHAMSMGSIILQAADERVMSPNSRMMLHYGSVGAPYIHAKDFQRLAEFWKKEDEHMEQLYLTKIREKLPNYSLDQLRELLKFDNYLTPEEAINLGLADEILK